MVAKIDREAEPRAGRQASSHHRQENSLVDPQVIEALFRASRDGVQIDLIIRGLCALRPGIPGVSENIRVRSIVGRFLEHSRVFYYGNDGSSELYLASADWMERNFFRRVEIAFPVREQSHHDRILRDLNYYLVDNTLAWSLGRDGKYTRCERGDDELRDAQSTLLARYAAGGAPLAAPLASDAPG